MKILVVCGAARSLVVLRMNLLLSMKACGHEVVACSGDSDVGAEAELAKIGIKVVTLTMARRSRTPRQDRAYFLSLLSLMRSEAPNLCLAYSTKAVIYAALAASRIGGIMIALMITGAGAARAAGGLPSQATALVVRCLLRRAIRRADIVLFQNEEDARLLAVGQPGGRPRVVKVPGSGVDIVAFPPCEQNQGSLVFLFAGRLLVSKGVRVFASAALTMTQRYGGLVRFIIAGPFAGPGADAVGGEEVEEWSKLGCIEYVGEREDVRPLLRLSSVVVLPSWYGEGQPRILLEALATGRAVITCDSVGCRATIQDGVEGFLVKPKSAESLVLAMERFLQDRSLSKVMGMRARCRAVEVYDVQKVNGTILGALGLC